MTDAERTRFDALLHDALKTLPPSVREVLDEVPLIVDDKPDEELLAQLKRDGLLDDPHDEDVDEADLGPMGLHSGVAITDRSVGDSGVLPPQIHLFREAVVDFAGGWDQADAEDEIYEEIRITLLHEIGHHFGLDEGELEDLGMG